MKLMQWRTACASQFAARPRSAFGRRRFGEHFIVLTDRICGREASPTAKGWFRVDRELSEDPRRRCKLWNFLDKDT
jgi:hypothetical protein